MKKHARSHPLWLAYILHRVSGIVLALFLPLHFWVLSLAITNPQSLDSFLLLTDSFAVKVVEFGLVFLLAVHLFGGLRLMALEWLPWSGSQKTLVALASAASFCIATLFFLRAV